VEQEIWGALPPNAPRGYGPGKRKQFCFFMNTNNENHYHAEESKNTDTMQITDFDNVTFYIKNVNIPCLLQRAFQAVMSFQCVSY